MSGVLTPYACVLRQLLLKAVSAPPARGIGASHAAHAAHRSAGAAAAVRSQAAKAVGKATPLFASAAIAAKAARASTSAPARPSTAFLRKEVRSAGKAAVKVAALAKAAKATETAAEQSKTELVRARVAKIPLRTAMNIVEKGAAHSLAQADKNAVEAALLRATLSMPGQRKAEKAAAAAAARAAANKPSAAWLAGAKSLADRNPYAAMNIPVRKPQLRQRSSSRGRLGKNSAMARTGRGVLASRGITALSHSGYSEKEGEAYRRQAGRHPIDVGGNDKMISTIHPDETGDIVRPNYNDPYVKGTAKMGVPVKPEQVERQWANGHYHPYKLVHRDDRYVSVGRLLTHRDSITRRESKMPTMEEEEEGGVETAEEQAPEAEEEEQDCQWGKDVYGRCYHECTPSREDYTKCHDGSPLWHDPVPLNVLCKGHENATWCQEPEGEEGEGGEGGGESEDKARTVQLASIGGGQGTQLGGTASGGNAANAPTLAGGVPVAGGKIVWLPLNSLTQGAGGAPAVQEAGSDRAGAAARFVTAATQAPTAVAPQVPTWDPKVGCLAFLTAFGHGPAARNP